MAVTYWTSATAPLHGAEQAELRRAQARRRLRGQRQKAAWVSNGTIAETAALYTAIDDGDGVIGRGVILVELDALVSRRKAAREAWTAAAAARRGVLRGRTGSRPKSGDSPAMYPMGWS